MSRSAVVGGSLSSARQKMPLITSRSSPCLRIGVSNCFAIAVRAFPKKAVDVGKVDESLKEWEKEAYKSCGRLDAATQTLVSISLCAYVVSFVVYAQKPGPVAAEASSAVDSVNQLYAIVYSFGITDCSKAALLEFLQLRALIGRITKVDPVLGDKVQEKCKR
eukprot:CAMPEP_0202895560 /NCGR_PEP_ID=MMETSP1392-20130828/4730_1 /ASSEMBLY_ACC=CAM_ASM_000868 /TAXON_ID=225041 /ORGANISM="Chlamydomonas chlamydogama, Strain SAG 11-48b" /LENGTH=162 /DNA_ID=CAMNT_0049580605 /DNA_START=181 /DNA_END=669 /DNA_ORIENTATION=+